MYMNKPIISFVIGFILLAFFITDEMRMLLQFIDICYMIHFSKVNNGWYRKKTDIKNRFHAYLFFYFS